jgi:predicted unusual protein kinase regulating ubiquinone biosynthesis (AarF/ABC1/UbiB family)
MFSAFAPGMDVKALVNELRERIMEELDYTLEAGSQGAFALMYADDEDFVIPAVVAQAETVLVTEWLDGRPLSDLIVNGSQAERDEAGTRYLRFLFSGPNRVGMLHADPHPGNYRMLPDGRLGVLDFGAVAQLPDGFPASIGRLLRRALDGDHETVLEGLREEGFVKPGVRVDPQPLLDYLAPFVEPAQHATFRFDRDWMRGQFTRLKDPRQENWAVGWKLNLPPEYLLVHRVWLGGVGVLCQLGAEVPMRAELDRWLPGFAEE